MDVKEIRNKVFGFFRKRNLPVPEKWTDETVRDFYQKRVHGEGRSIERSYTRSANLRAVGGPTESAAPVTAPLTEPTISSDEREAMRRRALAAMSL